MSVIESRLASLVHDSARDDPFERLRHERFIITRMLAGVLALCCLPPYLLWRGVPSLPETVAIACLVLPILAAVMIARTGNLPLAHGLSSAALAGFIVCVAATSGGVKSAATVWLAAVPLEALLSGSGRAALAASGVAVFGALLIAALDISGLLPAVEPWPVTMAMPVFAITAIGHATALALQHAHSEGGRRAVLQARDARDRSLLQAIDDLVTWHDRNGQVLKASAAAAKLVGVPAPSLVGRGLLSRVHVSDRPAFLKAVSDAAVSIEPVVVQFRLHTGWIEGGEHGSGAGGPETRRVIWAETRAHRIEKPDAAEDDYAVVAVTRDITEHRRRADELDQAREQAERADLSKSRFLATVSHELRTPLNAIIGFSEVLSTDGAMMLDVDRRREYAGIVHQSGLHLLAVVNTLLDMSKIEQGKFDFVAEPFDPAAVAQSCCDLLQLKAERAGVRLLRDIPEDLPELVADARACKQILINLLSNAVRFTPKGGRIRMIVRREGARLAFTIADTGIGVSEGDLPRLGEPFFQAGSGYGRAHEGTGLGLSVVRGLVGLHGGDLSIESALGEGTSVTVRLPVDCRNGKASCKAAIRVNAVPRRTAAANLLRLG
jgi:cell cycle sensor histidine kinase DivJ